MTENLIYQLIPHQGCVISRTVDGIDIVGSAMNWVMSAGVAPFTCRAPFAFRVVGKTDSTNLRMHWHRGELIFNWECSVRELRVHDPATAEQHGIKDKGFITPTDWHEIVSHLPSRPIIGATDDWFQRALSGVAICGCIIPAASSVSATDRSVFDVVRPTRILREGGCGHGCTRRPRQ